MTSADDANGAARPSGAAGTGRSWGRWVGWGLAAVAVGIGLVSFLKKGTSELPVYTDAAMRLAGGQEMYRPDDAKPFSYPPFFAVPFLPWNVLPASWHRAVWYFANVAVIVLILRSLARTVAPILAGPGVDRVPSRGRWIAFWVAFALLAAKHVLAVFQNQSHDLLIAGLLVWAASAWGRQREFMAGFVTGIAGACKATPLLLGLPGTVQRRIVFVGAVPFGFFVASLLPDLLFPRADGRLWLLAWYEIMVAGIEVGGAADREGVWSAATVLNQSLSGTIHRLTSAPPDASVFVRDVCLIELGPTSKKAVTLVGQLAVLGWVAVASVRRFADRAGPAERRMHRLGEVGLVACGMVLLSPMSSKSHFCVLMLPAAFCVADLLGRRRDPVVLTLLVLATLLGSASTKGLTGRDLGQTLLGYGVVTWATVALLIATGLALWRRADALHSVLGDDEDDDDGGETPPTDGAGDLSAR